MFDAKMKRSGAVVSPEERGIPAGCEDKEAGAAYKKGDIDFGYSIDRRRAGREKSGSGEKDRAVILCAGDLMCEPAMSEAAFFDGDYDFRPCFKHVAPILHQCDFAVANLETMVSDRIPYAHEKHRVEHHSGPRFHCNAPVEYLQALRYAGFDAFVLANNHNADGGYEGLVDTLDNIDRLGFQRTGMFKNAGEPRVLVRNINGIVLGLLSYTEHINRDLDTELFTPEGCEVLLNRLSRERLERDIAAARAQGAEYLICYVHFLGREYSHEVIQRQRNTAQMVADAGIDCIMGSHTHSLQEYDLLTSADGRPVPVVYSLGNFITSDNMDMITRKNVIYKLELRKVSGKVFAERESYIPCRVVEGLLSSHYTVFPTQQKYRGQSPSAILDRAQAEIARVIGPKLPVDEEFAFDMTQRELTVQKLCCIVGQGNVRGNPALADLALEYVTAHYTWVRKGCAFFSCRNDAAEEREARIAWKQGAAVLFCSRIFTAEDGSAMPCVVLADPMRAFYEICRWIRSFHELPVIGITGTVGKTTLKDMLKGVLDKKFETLENAGSASTHAAVGDVIQKLNEKHRVYLQEMWAQAPGWVEGTSRMIRPGMCVITNIGCAHLDQYGDGMQLLLDKTSVIRELPEDGVAFLNYDDESLAAYQTDRTVVSFAVHNKAADYVAENLHREGEALCFDICSAEGRFEAKLHVPGEHNVLHALAVFAVGRRLGMEPETILKGLEEHRSEGMRQNLVNIGGYRLYMDCQMSEPYSLVSTVRALGAMETENGGRKVAVLGDMPQIGRLAVPVHREVAEALKGAAVDQFLLFGPAMGSCFEVLQQAGCPVLHTEDREELERMIAQQVKKGDIVLFKGGHTTALAKSVDSVFGTSFHLSDGTVLVERGRSADTEDYYARWIDGVVEIRKPRRAAPEREIPGRIGDVPVVRIGREAFQGAATETLILPPELKNLGFAAFYKCAKLREIRFAEGLLVLERSAFNSCTALESAELPSTLIEIGLRAFSGCTQLKRLWIPPSVGHIGADAFDGCGELVIQCEKDSCAHRFAEEQGLAYELI